MKARRQFSFEFIMAMLCFFSASCSPEKREEAAVETGAVEALPFPVPDPDTMLVVSALDFAADFSENAIAANQKYGGQIYAIIGHVVGVDDGEYATIHLETTRTTPDVWAQSVDKNFAQRLRRGDVVTLFCAGVSIDIPKNQPSRCEDANDVLKDAESAEKKKAILKRIYLVQEALI